MLSDKDDLIGTDEAARIAGVGPTAVRRDYRCEIRRLRSAGKELPVTAKILAVQAPRRRFASWRTSSLSILYFSVLSGMPR